MVMKAGRWGVCLLGRDLKLILFYIIATNYELIMKKL
jgi:hypothetical protein